MVDFRAFAAAAFAAFLTSSAAFASAELAKSKNCVACHSVERKMIGPAYKAVAERYAKDEFRDQGPERKNRDGRRRQLGSDADAPSTRRFARGSRSPGEVDLSQQ